MFPDQSGTHVPRDIYLSFTFAIGRLFTPSESERAANADFQERHRMTAVLAANP